MTRSTFVMDPMASSQSESRQMQQTLEELHGKVVGFIDNAKPNFHFLVDDLGELLTARYGVSRIIKRRKRGASVPAPDAVMKELTEQCDLVIAGSGD